MSLPPCPNKAKFMYPWAGKIMKGCEDHARAMVIIAQAIGYPMETPQPIITTEDCQHMDDLKES